MKSIQLLAMSLVLSPTLVLASPLFDQYDFNNAVSAHQTAEAMVDTRGSEVAGNYKMIATASHSYRGDFQKKDMNGIANQDGSILKLGVSYHATTNIVQVTQLNLVVNGQNQGPADAVFNAEGNMTFAQYSYRAGVINEAVFFYSECRLLADADLLCAKRFMVQNPAEVNPQQAAMHNTIIGYDLYTRL